MATPQQPDQYRAYLEDKHSRLNASPELIDELVEKATGANIVAKRKLILGEVNEVYEATNSKDKSVIVRISRREDPQFAGEKWAINKSKEAGVPAPEILLIETVSDKDTPLTFCIEEKLQGEPLNSQLDQLSGDEKRRLVMSAGEILGRIHSVNTAGFGNIDQHGIGSKEKWAKFMLRDEKDIERLRRVASKVGLGSGLIDRAFRTIRDADIIYEAVSPHLIHGDYGPKHILVHEGKISGIIDFEGCKSGDPAWDFAWWDFFQSPGLPTNWLMDGYENKSFFGPDFKTRLRLVRLALSLTLLDYYDSENNPSGLRHTKIKFLKDIG